MQAFSLAASGFTFNALLLAIDCSTSTVELLNNSLAAIVLDQLCYIGSSFVFQFVRSKYSKMTSRDDFMQIKCKTRNEKPLAIIILLICIYFFTLTFLGPITGVSYLDLQSQFFMQDLKNITSGSFITIFLTFKLSLFIISFLVFGAFRWGTGCLDGLTFGKEDDRKDGQLGDGLDGGDQEMAMCQNDERIASGWNQRDQKKREKSNEDSSGNIEDHNSDIAEAYNYQDSVNKNTRAM